MDKYVWVKRPQEWINANPGKGTMYKEILSEVVDDTVLVKEVRNKRKYVSKANKISDCGIYAIICEKAKRVYVGQSINMSVRMRNHKACMLRTQTSKMGVYIKMGEDIEKYGIDSFFFSEYKPMIGANTNDLIIEETKAMHDFINRGYELYNISLMGNIYCPDEYKVQLQAFIFRLIDDPELIRLIL